MSPKTIGVGVLALVFGLASAMGVKAFLDSRREIVPTSVVPHRSVTPIVVSRRLIPRGRTIAAEDVELKEWPTEMVTKEMVENLESVVDQAVQFTLFEGEPVLASKISLKPILDMASHLSPGMRAFTIHIPTVGSGVAGFILPGNRVDVLLTVVDNLSQKENRAMTVTLLQGVELLAVDQQTEAPPSNKMDPTQMHSVTLAVTAIQAAKLALAGSRGTLNLALRNPNDEQETATEPVTIADLQYLKDPDPVVGPITPHVLQIRTLRGNQIGSTSVYPLHEVPQNLAGPHRLGRPNP